MYLVPNVLRSKNSQTMNSNQLIEYNKCTKCAGDDSPRPLYKKSKLSVFLDQQFEPLHSLFLLYVQIEIYQNRLNLT